MYELEQAGVGDTRSLVSWAAANVFGAKCNLKGFDYAWIITSRNWKAGDRILDGGAGYSTLPIQLAEQYQCEVWAVDDFGIGTNDDFWARGKEPRDWISAHPQVRYVLERLGDQNPSSLPRHYFDCIYSASALEHVPPQQIRSVWQHMDRLLKPGGHMLHALDMSLPSGRGLLSLGKAFLIDYLWPLLPAGYRIRNVYCTPTAYLRVAASSLPSCRVRLSGRGLHPLRLVLDPHVVIEPLDWALNRVRKDGLLLDLIPRTTTFFIELRKSVNEI